MNINWMNELIWVIRIVAATLCGACIGYERENNLKTAGIRTHSIVALTSCLMMLVSKYGFTDVLGANVNLDPSRIAAGIVTAIGFLGAGVIFTRKLTVSGLTTSAWRWEAACTSSPFSPRCWCSGCSFSFTEAPVWSEMLRWKS